MDSQAKILMYPEQRDLGVVTDKTLDLSGAAEAKRAIKYIYRNIESRAQGPDFTIHRKLARC